MRKIFTAIAAAFAIVSFFPGSPASAQSVEELLKKKMDVPGTAATLKCDPHTSATDIDKHVAVPALVLKSDTGAKTDSPNFRAYFSIAPDKVRPAAGYTIEIEKCSLDAYTVSKINTYWRKAVEDGQDYLMTVIMMPAEEVKKASGRFALGSTKFKHEWKKTAGGTDVMVFTKI